LDGVVVGGGRGEGEGGAGQGDEQGELQFHGLHALVYKRGELLFGVVEGGIELGGAAVFFPWPLVI